MNELLERFFSEELTKSEKKELFDQIEVSEENKEEFARVQNTVALSKLFRQEGDKAWMETMRRELDKRIAVKQRRRIGFAILKYAAVFLILFVNVWLVADRWMQPEPEPLFTQIEVPPGQRIHLTLADGTKAWFSPRSVVKIPNEFNRKERVIELDGEGFFAVTKDAERPFIVKTKQYDVRVLGTKFNVFAYAKTGRFETQLVEGSVQIENTKNPAEQIILKPNEQVVLENYRLVKSVLAFNNKEYLDSGIFYFSNKRFSEILNYLSLWYDVKFDIENTKEIDRYVSGKFRQSDDIERILKALQGVHSFRYQMIAPDQIKIY